MVKCFTFVPTSLTNADTIEAGLKHLVRAAVLISKRAVKRNLSEHCGLSLHFDRGADKLCLILADFFYSFEID